MNTEKFMKVLLIVALSIIGFALLGDVIQSMAELIFDNGL